MVSNYWCRERTSYITEAKWAQEATPKRSKQLHTLYWILLSVKLIAILMVQNIAFRVRCIRCYEQTNGNLKSINEIW